MMTWLGEKIGFGLATSYLRQWEEARAENARLQAELKVAEAAVEKGGTVMFTGVSVPKRELDEAKAEIGRLSALLIDRRRERDGYKALAERRGEALEKTLPKLGLHIDAGVAEVVRAAIAMTPEEAREKEEKAT
jgi:hypothetical protein